MGHLKCLVLSQISILRQTEESDTSLGKFVRMRIATHAPTLYGNTPYKVGGNNGNSQYAEEERTALDLRMTGQQKDEMELAANLSGISMSQWAIENLLACARETISRSNHTVMSPEDFDAFPPPFDEPMNPALAEFASRKTIWEQQ